SSGSTQSAPPPPATPSLLFVTNGSVGSIDVMTVDTTSGVPKPVANSPFADGPSPRASAVDSQKHYLYVASSSGEVRGYQIDSSSASLSAISGSPFVTGADSVAIALDPGAQFVLTANGTSNSVSVFKVGSSGTLTQVSGSPFAAGNNPDAIVVAPGNFVYAGNVGDGTVSAYTMDTSTGALAAVAGSPFAAGGHPLALTVDPSGTHLYAADSNPAAVSAFAINPGNGALTAVAGSPFAEPNGAALSIVMDHAGVLLHIANGINVDCYQVDGSSGALTWLGGSTSNGRAIALAADDPDNFVYALDNVDNQLEVFAINPTVFNLTLIPGNPYPLFQGSGGQALGPTSITFAR
ncbi:MAG TPA: beta-propeller fold lactonase family protein, partial [Steroidobacteraceae bacterium]|nr:beta-propeller fold lactonase family protein [Steroidobacteraceae bacterium]